MLRDDDDDALQFQANVLVDLVLVLLVLVLGLGEARELHGFAGYRRERVQCRRRARPSAGGLGAPRAEACCRRALHRSSGCRAARSHASRAVGGRRGQPAWRGSWRVANSGTRSLRQRLAAQRCLLRCHGPSRASGAAQEASARAARECLGLESLSYFKIPALVLSRSSGGHRARHAPSTPRDAS